MPRETEKHKKILSSQAILIPDEKAKMEKEWMEVTKKADINKGEEKSTLLHLWTSATSKKYEYIPENVRESKLKCGHKYEYIPGNVRKNNLKFGNY